MLLLHDFSDISKVAYADEVYVWITFKHATVSFLLLILKKESISVFTPLKLGALWSLFPV